ncbi:DUF2721 domain-containing protein [Zooshikella marina]|uniref:DUF2721 domain-containing protein n=1 Tax=Zooshikella ganghwensis TaxID=202772 RepID=A0A4P9VS63_9GAMM|nr:DUF2721 domain-containing protein [Zooshikella ganghwensis]MBU2706609.1 DUF2721 domain-containing protein [Zooshikella ganghwensis]RDH45946.1 DUF2721 domain-containing protein [Zooshikella ganghwensis]
MNELTEISSLLSAIISPIVLISGVGLILLTLTNRLGRAIDRTRALVLAIKQGNETICNPRKQLTILYRRCMLLRSSMVALSFSTLFACLIIICLFILHFFHISTTAWIFVFFGCSIISVLVSVVLFIYDLILNLQAVSIDVRLVGDELPGSDSSRKLTQTATQ